MRGAEPTVGSEPGRGDRLGRYAAGWLVAALPAFALITLLWLHAGRTDAFGHLALGAFALAFPVMVRRLRIPRGTGFVDFLLAVGFAFAIISILTGWANGLTDEPFTTPRFTSFVLAGHDPYTTQMVFDYTQYGKVLPSQSYYLYLPLLMFLQVPGLDYKWLSLACWALTVLLLRRRFDAAVLMAQPYAMLVAASGYNDPVVLLLLTAGFAGVGGRRQKWAEYLSLGCKQFANAFVIVYYAVQRDWRNLLGTAVVSAAFLAPFYVWGGPAIICPAVFADRLPGCTHGFGAGILLNYPLWALWLVALFFTAAWSRIRAWLDRHRVHDRLRGTGVDMAGIDRWPSVLVVGASAISLGLTVFVTVWVTLGGTPVTWLGGAAIGTAAATLWTWAWGGPWRFERTEDGARGRAGTSFVVGQLLAAGVNLAVLATTMVAGVTPLAGESVGIGLGTVVGYAIAFAGGLFAPVERPPAAAGRSPGNAAEGGTGPTSPSP